MGLLKADDSRVALLRKGLQVREQRQEGTDIPLKKIHYGWPGRETTSTTTGQSTSP